VSAPAARLTIGTVDGKSRCTAIEITAAPGEFLTGEDLRRVPVARLITEAVDETPAPLPNAPDGFPASGPTDEVLRYIATAYARAYAAGHAPTKAVEELGLTYSTASRWVALARAAGYLSRTGRGKASGAAPI
jgi:hypothetical protein